MINCTCDWPLLTAGHSDSCAINVAERLPGFKGFGSPIPEVRPTLTDDDCFFCGRKTQATAGDPSLWPLYLGFPGGNGALRCYCTRCVIQRLETRDHATRASIQYGIVKEAFKDSEKVGAEAAITWALTHYDNWLHGSYDAEDLLDTQPEVDPGYGTHIREAWAISRSLWLRWKNR